jgi:hypothetical protein
LLENLSEAAFCPEFDGCCIEENVLAEFGFASICPNRRGPVAELTDFVHGLSLGKCSLRVA